MRDLDLSALGGIARLAGHAVLEVYHNGFSVQEKEDHSPLTTADTRSSGIILEALSQVYPDVPVVCEETKAAPYAERQRYKRFFLVDPLDGTKEFIRRNDEFCVLIALVERGRPVYGVIHAPVTDTLYSGGPGIAAEKRVAGGAPQPIHAAEPVPGAPLLAMGSRSHLDPDTTAYLARFPSVHMVSRGSALKFAALAEGTCHLYPRLAPTWEWDTAAGHALLLGAGGVLTTPDGKEFSYNKPELLNGPFLARSFSATVIEGNSILL